MSNSEWRIDDAKQRFALPTWFVTLLAVCWVAPALGGLVDRHFTADRPIDLVHLKLQMKVDLEKKHVDATATIDLKALRDVSSIRFDAADFQVKTVTLKRDDQQAKPIRFDNDDDAITISLGDKAFKRNDKAQVRIEYTITDPKKGLHFFAPAKYQPDQPLQMWSQGESNETHYWVPCFDHPNEMQTTEMIATVPAGFQAVSNGKLVSKKDNPDKTVTFHWLQDKPHATYLISLVVGRFYVEKQMWHGTPIEYYVPPEDKNLVQATFGRTTQMLDLFSKKIGVAYPWDKYAQVCTVHFDGGMENTSATTLMDDVMHDERAGIDGDDDTLIAHELSHQWFGDLLTCRNWSHVWLNEGFASFFEAVWAEHADGKDAYDYTIHQFSTFAFLEGRFKPVIDYNYKNPDQLFDGRVYQKGVFVLHMLRQRVGDEMFFKSIKRYVTQHQHQNVETKDLRSAFEDETGMNLERFFHDWLERPGHPVLNVKYTWNDQKKQAQLSVTQKSKSGPFEFPFPIVFHFQGKESINVSPLVTGKEHHFEFTLPAEPTMVCIDPENSVLKKMTVEKPMKLWITQLTKAPDMLSRLQAAKHLGQSQPKKNVQALADAFAKEPFWGVARQIASVLGKVGRSEAGGSIARDALLAGCRNPNPRIRKASVTQLGKMKPEEQVAAQLRTLIVRPDESYRVQAAAIASYARQQPDDRQQSGEVIKLLTSCLDRSSPDEIIRRAVLKGLGEQKDGKVLDVLMEWSQWGKPGACRRSAVQAMGKLAEKGSLSDQGTDRTVKRLSTLLKEKNDRVVPAAISALAGLGKKAAVALPMLNALAKQDDNPRLQRQAKKAIKDITGEKAPDKKKEKQPNKAKRRAA